MFLNISWQVWVVVALVLAVALYLVFTDDGDLYHYDDLASYDSDDLYPTLRPSLDAGHPSERVVGKMPELAAGYDADDPEDPDPLDPLSSYYDEQNLLGQRFDGRNDER